ncbi:MAG: 30S ribosomal protein S8 [Parcubacteria group bacterium GW2011_GWC1_43_11b]|nr:MAG: 30S ribosomal protein S8 [Parcubacteria group bacterium GW2011_GWB1_42_9]KKS89092.1 MAG: 30S ribosomal protein S8 [Parcubacteria group bacterium GW2011_GWC1_43_11b]KKT09742.1 MAG: 30S ribosomal protein S8 [Parcubacteria group bacterium GW2011_GWA1_43_21]
MFSLRSQTWLYARLQSLSNLFPRISQRWQNPGYPKIIMVTDPISNMLIAIKNGAKAGKETVIIPHSNLKYAIASLLEREGYIKNVNKRGKKVKKFIACDIVYGTDKKTAKLTDLKRISKPSCRVYCPVGEIRNVRNGFGLAVFSTPKGLLTDREARAQKVGGELMFKIW